MRTFAVAALAAASFAPALAAQATMAPINDLPNPYRTISGWAKMPEGRTWGSTSAVAVDKDGTSIWVAERCGANNCVGSALDPVLHFDANGNLLAHFGAGRLLSPHGIVVDNERNVWVVDCTCTLGRGAPPPAGVGHQIHKFSPDGKLLLTLGTPGGGRDSLYFFQPNAIYIAPNGEMYVSEGHSSNQSATARVFKFSKDGKLLRAFGHWGKGDAADEFDQPHALAMDSKGRLYVGDRGNNRIKIFDQDFRLLDTWYQFSRPSGIVIDANDDIYVADSESGTVNPAHGAWKRGIRIGSVKDGVPKYFIPDPDTTQPSTSSAEGIAIDRNGVIYGAEVGQKRLQRYVRKR